MLWPTASRATTSTIRRTAHRADIQGLRAVAVLLVIADHLIGRPHGGFVGVDVFFVISGFLITGLLLREETATGRISLVQFYKRRVKRIAPASLTVLAVVLAVSTVVLSPVRVASVVQDALWAAASAGNWRMIALGTDYMHATDAISPLQHFWSLAVEEQFYLIWPLLLILAIGVGRRLRGARGAALAAVVLIGAASIAFGAWQSVAAPTAAYFSTFSRGWELALGALLALLEPRLHRIGARARAGLLAAGLVLIAAAALGLSPASTFPVPWALVPTLGAAAVIAAGSGGAAPGSRVLANRLAVWVGECSYSLYLWHFPVIVFVAVLLPQRGGRYWATALVIMFLLAHLSHRFIEQPLRTRSWRRPFRAVASGRAAGAGPRLVPAAAALGLIATCAFVFVTRTPLAVPATEVPDLVAHVSPTSIEAGRVHQVAAALTAKSWPVLTPAPSALSESDRAPEWVRDGCLGGETGSRPDVVANAERCTYGPRSARHVAVLLGDSTAISWMPGLRTALGPAWRIEVWTEQQCPAIRIQVLRGDGTIATDCTRLQAAAAAHVGAVDPDLVLLTTESAELGRLADGRTGSPALEEWQRATATTVRTLAQHARRVVVLDAPPDIAAASDCVAPASGPSNCITGITPAYLAVSRAQRAAVEQVGAADVAYPDDLDWFCDRGRCPSFVDGHPTTVDGRHLTATTARALAPLLRPAILG